MTSTTLVVTNDFPPRVGGIEAFVRAACRALDDDVVVLTSREPGARVHDAALPFEVIRRDRVLLPTPPVARAATRLLRSRGISRVLFGAAAPLGLLAPALRAAGADHVLGLTHGHETWWARVPPTHLLLRRIGDGCDHLGYISAYTRGHLVPALSPGAAAALLRIPPPYDERIFRPGPRAGDPVRPRCVAVGRMVRRKGFDLLLDAWATVQAEWAAATGAGRAARPTAVGAGDPRVLPELVVVGDGPQRAALERRVARLGLVASVRFTGALRPAAVAEQLQQATVFAFPVRPRLGGLDSEGLGLAVVEAAACGLPVVVARSGGAPDTLVDGVTGVLVEPGDPAELARALLRLLGDPALAARLGAAGAEHAAAGFSQAAVRRAVRTALALP